MSGFKLDTSGVIYVGSDRSIPGGHVEWDDLSSFAQGYIEAAFEEWFWEQGVDGQPFLGFSDLAPATLAAMLGDCERFADLYGEWPLHYHGRGFWIGRQKDKHSPEFAPITLYLADDGKIHQREAR